MPQTTIQPYLFFNGRCKEALEFYSVAIGATIDMVMLYSESPEPPAPGTLPDGFENKVMHASFRVGDSTLMASDGCGDTNSFAAFSLSLAVQTQAEADRAFAALADGGQITMPLSKTFWSPCFGMLTDRFGMGWMVSVVGEQAHA